MEALEQTRPPEAKVSKHPSHGQDTSPTISGTTSEFRSNSGAQEKRPMEEQDEENLRRYQAFIKSSLKLEEKLPALSHKVLKLGSALGLSVASVEVHQGLEFMRTYLAENVKTFETLLKNVDVPGAKVAEKHTKRRHRSKMIRVRKEVKLDHEGPGGPLAQTQQTDISASLRDLSTSLNSFSIALADFDDYYDMKTYSAISGFETEVRILSEALAYFGRDGDTPELRTYIAGRLATARNHMDKTTAALDRFTENGIPCISAAQKRSSGMIFNASTVATFFAGVAASTLQYSVTTFDTKLEKAVNTLWFASLVLSIGSAVTGLLSLTWRQAVFSSPKRSLPVLIRFWIRSGYLVLLIASIITFIAGLVVYVYVLQRTDPPFWIIASCTAFCGISLASVSFYFARERWYFSMVRKHRPRRTVVWIFCPREQGKVVWAYLKSLAHVLRRRILYMLWRTRLQIRLLSWEGMKNTISQISKNLALTFRRLIFSCFMLKRSHDDIELGQDSAEVQPIEEAVTSPEQGTVSQAEHTMARERGVDVDRYAQTIKALSPEDMDPDPIIKIHDLQFSPDGKWLAVCSKYWCGVIETKPPFKDQYLWHFQDIKQVKWAPDGKHLLSRARYSIQIWSVQEEDSELDYEGTVRPGKGLVDVEWLSNDKFIALSNDAKSLFTVDVNFEEQIVETRLPAGLTIYEMTTMINSNLILFLATRSVGELPEDKGINCIIVYDMRDASDQSAGSVAVKPFEISGTIKRKVPLLEEVIGLTSAANGKRFIVSYEDHPPEIWKIDEDKGYISLECKLNVEKQSPNGDWGHASFVGPSENIVACAEDNLVHFWRDTGGGFEAFFFLDISSGIGANNRFSREVHYHDDSDDDDDDDDEREDDKIPMIAWRYRSEGLPTMASAHLGRLRIWSSHLSEEGTNTVGSEENEGLLPMDKTPDAKNIPHAGTS